MFLVTNLDEFDWPSANVLLNGITNYFYVYNQPVLSGETLTIPVAKFIHREGIRIDPRKYDIEEERRR